MNEHERKPDFDNYDFKSEVESDHTVKTQWREADISAKAERLLGLMAWLDHTEDLIEMFKEDTEFSAELRGMAGIIKTRRNDISSQISAIRGEIESKRGSDSA